MYKYLCSLLAFLGIQLMNAQGHEIGVFLGGSNPISDVGRTYYVFPNKLAYGGIYKWNFHDRVSLRFQVTKTNLRANDIQSDIAAKVKRQFAFSNNLTETMLGLEYNFFKFNMDNLLEMPMTPYFFTGASYVDGDELYFQNLTTRPLEAQKMPNRHRAWAIPVVMGFKMKIAIRWILAAEIGTRFTFTNNLDGSLPSGGNLSFGNKTSNDWYTFSGFTLTYTFGRKPCYCRE
ncbi:conserved exported hypothetical protein [Capnocytophaga canis]|uniref:DUF6089 domain-containing protein n=1 Tax=Capnocytophaga canis TaxID=1848903 RepID=A0A0B7HSR2_9FLAO|nr:DUF6089 family protein [Capnocytophaga canis]RIY37693.1 hypothetical protein CKY20_03085 [Capnocytophaga canis]CEN42350.1 conserved exported hypothetical protein [Capnocytophaga canis]CEN43092.1 conserved exported hypothetical protein [Capnocytophaga canis]CEN53731.1 conserved exported hypothetical protein [Capnocytophaga canis]